MSSFVTGSTFGCAVVHSLMNESNPSPPKPFVLTPFLGSLSAVLPLNHPIVSRLGNENRNGGPLSHVASARPSWKMTFVFATLIFLIGVRPGNLDNVVRKTALMMTRSTVNQLRAGFTNVAILGRIGVCNDLFCRL